jgi:diguanylate cyclase (GGDEF)-like protein/PAS domain S-box-containing protein
MEGVVVTDVNSQIISVNPAFTEITGYEAAEAVGRKPSMLRSDHHGEDFYGELWGTLLRNGRWQGEIWNRRKNGEAYLEWLTINMIAGLDGQPQGYIGVFHDITEIRAKDEHIRHMAFHDALTGLPNRLLLADRLGHGISHAARSDRRLAVMLLDLDAFKGINDTLGHDVGDLLLRTAADRMVECLRTSDTVARMGGDEFVVFLEEVEELEYCAAVAKKLIAALSKPMNIGDHTVQIGASIGIACYPDDGGDGIELLQHADTAMYAAKSAGRGTYRFFQSAMTAKATLRLKLETELRHGIRDGQLELFFQPKIHLADMSIFGAEALVRWRHPEDGLISPADFIPVAEETGLIVDIGNWVIEEACRQAGEWQGKGLAPLRIAVNVSAKQLHQGDLAERIEAMTRRYGISPASLEIELTESAVMADPEQVAKVFGRLRELGATVAIDDFGTGYSSLAYLRRLPIDVLKIDRSFVTNADRIQADAEIVKTILSLGQSLNLHVVAEGVERESQAALLRDLGCTAAQGFLYARPQPADKIADWLGSWRDPVGAPAAMPADRLAVAAKRRPNHQQEERT